MPETRLEFLNLPHLLILSAEPRVPQTLIGVEVGKGNYAAGQPYRVLVYGGNINGEVYIYEVTNIE